MGEYAQGLNFTIQDIHAGSYAPPVTDPTLPKYRLVGRDTSDMFKNKNILDSSNLVSANYLAGTPAPKPLIITAPALNDAILYDGTAWVNTPLPGGGGSFGVGNTLFVDAVYGDDATAQAFNPAQAYKTCAAAADAAAAHLQPVLIYVRAGSYTEGNLARPTITANWYFELGTTVTATGVLFDCNDTQTYTINIWGRAQFIGATDQLVRLAQTGAKSLYLECKSMSNAFGSCIYLDGAAVQATVRVMENIFCSRAINVSSADAELLDPRNSAIYLGDVQAASLASIYVQYISNTGGGTCLLTNVNVDATWYVTSNIIKTTGPTAVMQFGTNGVVQLQTNDIITGAILFTPAASAVNIGAVCVKGGTLTATTESILAAGANTIYAAPCVNVSAGTLNITSLKITTTGYLSGTTASAVSVTGGVANLTISELICTSTNVVRQTAGQLALTCNKITNVGAVLNSPLINIISGTADITSSISASIATNANCVDGAGTIRCNFYNVTLVGTGSFFGSTGAATGAISLNVTNCSLASGSFIDISGSTTNTIGIDVNADRVTSVSGSCFAINRSANGATNISGVIKSFTSSGSLINFASSGTIFANVEFGAAQCGGISLSAFAASTVTCRLNQYNCTATNAVALAGTATAAVNINISALVHTGTRVFNITNNNVSSTTFMQCSTLQSNGALGTISGATNIFDLTNVIVASGITQTAGTLRVIFGFINSSTILTLSGGTSNITGVQMITSGLAFSQSAGTLSTQIASLTSSVGCLAITGSSVCTSIIRGGRFQSGDAACYLISNTNALSDILLQMSNLVSGRTDIGTTKAIVEISGNATISQQTDSILGTLTGAHALLISGTPTYRFDIFQIVTTGRVMTKSSTTNITGDIGQVILRSATPVTEASILFAMGGSGRTTINITEIQHLLPSTGIPVTIINVASGSVRVNATSINATTHSNISILNNLSEVDIDISEAEITGSACINSGTCRFIVSDKITSNNSTDVFQNNGTAKIVVGEVEGALDVVKQTDGTSVVSFNRIVNVSGYVFNIQGGDTFTGNCDSASANGMLSVSGISDSTIVSINCDLFTAQGDAAAINLAAGNVNIVMGVITGKFNDTIFDIRTTGPVCASVTQMQVLGAGAIINVRQRGLTTNPVNISGGCLKTQSGPLLVTNTYANPIVLDVTGFVTGGPQIMNITGGHLFLEVQTMEVNPENGDPTPIILATTAAEFGDLTFNLTCNNLLQIGESRTMTGIQIGDATNRNCYGSIDIQSMNVPSDPNGAIVDQGGLMTIYSVLDTGRLTVNFGLAQTLATYGIYIHSEGVADLDGLLISGSLRLINPAIRTTPIYIRNRSGNRGPSLKDLALISDGRVSIEARDANQDVRIYGTVTATQNTNNISNFIPGNLVISSDVV